MFGNIIYFDKKKVNDYMSIITGKKSVNITALEVKNEKGLGINFPMFTGDANKITSYTATMNENLLYDSNEFEKLLQGREDYFDFIDGNPDSYSITTMKRGYIARFESEMFIPEKFDIIQLIEQFKPMILESVSKNMQNEEKKAFNEFFKSSGAKIPVIYEIGDITCCSKIESKNLFIDYSQLEEYEKETVIVVARIISSRLVNKSIEIYDPLKDFISLNRMARRQFCNDTPDELKKLYSDDDYMRLEVLSIYQ